MDWLTAEIGELLSRGFVLTIWITGITSIFSLLLGIGVGTLKLIQRPITRQLAIIYIEIHRNVPALVLIIFWAFAFPNIFPLEIRRTIFFDNAIISKISLWTGLSIPYYTLAAGFALTLNTSAYLAELFRAGVGTIEQEHLDSARTLGAPKKTLLWQIIIPQGIRAAFPAISTRLIHNMKNTALASFVAMPEFFHGIQTAITYSFHAVELLLLASAVYLGLSFTFSFLLRWIENRLNQGSLVIQNG
ncbi:MAG: amino acid ABC transporter permease [Anaerolineales bacterium]|uniref:Amino acid ABC transporter permease n=1 Tax=Candidatus Desulfolinea nitratireducens TaxID=2841698 RepID=A0A8J6TDS8_9CHLR|nr:amino acid ABC transporter permease [Candidatus Desulfolinea nitratireducens]